MNGYKVDFIFVLIESFLSKLIIKFSFWISNKKSL